MCLLRCSARGQCDPITKQCVCDPFWTQNPIRRYFGDGESNCGNSDFITDVWTFSSFRSTFRPAAANVPHVALSKAGLTQLFVSVWSGSVH